VKVVLLEDVTAAAEKTYGEVLAFLEIDGEFQPEFRVYNEAPGHSLLERTVLGIYRSPTIKRMVQTVAPYKTRHRILNGIRTLVRDRPTKASHSDDELRRRCRPDVERLSRLIERDLSHWL
jgi:hypothetical protein